VLTVNKNGDFNAEGAEDAKEKRRGEESWKEKQGAECKHFVFI
jgi:hypothetical protein